MWPLLVGRFFLNLWLQLPYDKDINRRSSNTKWYSFANNSLVLVFGGGELSPVHTKQTAQIACRPTSSLLLTNIHGISKLTRGCSRVNTVDPCLMLNWKKKKRTSLVWANFKPAKSTNQSEKPQRVGTFSQWSSNLADGSVCEKTGRRGRKKKNLAGIFHHPASLQRPTLIQHINHEQTNSMLCLSVIVTLNHT